MSAIFFIAQGEQGSSTSLSLKNMSSFEVHRLSKAFIYDCNICQHYCNQVGVAPDLYGRGGGLANIRKCSCGTGFQLMEDGRTCKSTFSLLLSCLPKYELVGTEDSRQEYW